MLIPNQKLHITTQEVLDHPWIPNAKKASNVSLGETVKAGIKKFSVMNKLKNRDLRPIRSPMTICGDINGQFDDRAELFCIGEETVPVRTKNRQCSSGLQAVADVAVAIKAGFYDIGIGAGLESMTANPMSWNGSVNPRVDSHKKAAAATSSGKFKDEIIPIKTKIVDPKTRDEKPVTISVDDGVRSGTTLADLAKLKPVFKKDGSTTAGTSSQVSDGAGVVLLMKISTALQKGFPILGVFRTVVAVGVPPTIMCICPAVAIPAAVKAAVLEVNDIDLFEINEAFASPFLYCQKKLEIDPQKINVNGGARLSDILWVPQIE